MFHRFHVSAEDRDFLRFLWWENGNTEKEPKEYRMRVHIFGAASSPGCANYGMKYLAHKYEKDYPLAASFIHKNFYVDDGLVSVNSVEKANRLVKEAQEILANGNLRLHKFVSNSREVLSAIPESECASLAKYVDLNYSELPMQSVLGVKWNIETDAFLFKVDLAERPATRRGILKLRRPAEEQRMADLPADRVEPSPPFSYSGIDCFGPFYTKQGRKEFKRCFIAIRGAVRQIRSDQGTNFVGAKNELEKGLKDLDKERISTYLASKQCDFLMNVPEASHMGGQFPLDYSAPDLKDGHPYS
ncbi:hypothetical protein ROHU_033992 [Labeo rohita]|uniref:Uncharacterized protein n=1 Tax=Labeo rohita TaxID=84645 RepID=A0A498LAY7_LABRO|nr:hypothetical protein ROHU_033992 [Labeo rohita]